MKNTKITTKHSSGAAGEIEASCFNSACGTLVRGAIGMHAGAGVETTDGVIVDPVTGKSHHYELKLSAAYDGE